MATIVNTHEAKTHLSELIRRALAGEEIVIARAGKPAVKLVAVEEGQSRTHRPLGTAPEFAILADDAGEPLPDDWWDVYREENAQEGAA
jgi:prevent-host-death family protein